MNAPRTSKEELAVRLADPWWRLSNLYYILVKDPDQSGDTGKRVLFRPNAAQRSFVDALWYRNIILKARQLGFCVDPDTRVLTADLRWIRIGDIRPGQEVVACDEHGAGGKGQARRMRTASVQAVRKMQAERFRITFDDGRTVICTDRHPWLSRKAGSGSKWRSISGHGNEVAGRLKRGTQVRWITKPWAEPTVEDGWMGGMLDGEGSMAKDCHGAGVNVSQRLGPVWDRLVCYAAERGYGACIEADDTERQSKYGTTPVPKLAFNRMDELFRLVGQTRPTRFIERRWWEGRELPGKRDSGTGWATITGIEAIGPGEVVDMQTSTGTYIAEGFVSHNTTLIDILWLDYALFNKDVRCGIIAQDRDAAEVIFRDKVKYAYDNLPPSLREAMPLQRDAASELLFAHNNSSVRVATSMRSGTIDRLHVSEFGKICAKYPDKAVEVVTGSLPAVPDNGIVIIESTAEGREGEFYEMVQRAEKHRMERKKLTPKDFRIHFYPWWQAQEYRVTASMVRVSPEEHEYFDQIEAKAGTKLDPDQRAWWINTRDSIFNGADEKMWQEYPSTLEEAFQTSTAGSYYARDMAALRKRGGVMKVPTLDVPVNTFWDIGNSDGCAIWFHQELRGEDRFIGYMEAHGESLAYYAAELQKTGYIFNKHFLPHDAAHRKLSDTNRSTEELLNQLGVRNTVIVPVITDINAGIQMVRKNLKGAYFDEAGCKEGIARIDGYRKKFNRAAGRFIDEPDKLNGCSEGADALRQWAQAKELGMITEAGTSAYVSPPPQPLDWRLT